MSGKLIILTGAHGIVWRVFSENPTNFNEALHYYRSTSDILKSEGTPKHWETCPFFNDLLMYKEIDRDQEILQLLIETKPVVLIEQWHIGNIAWAKARASQNVQEYESRLQWLLEKLKGINLEIWYISVDPEDIFPDYRAYLQELSLLTRRFNFPTENLDGTAPTSFINKRIEHLLAH